MDGPNSAEQIAIMQLSCAYFVLDAFHVALWGLDPLFFGHHVFTTAYMLWSMALGVGGHGVMALMCIGEVWLLLVVGDVRPAILTSASSINPSAPR